MKYECIEATIDFEFKGYRVRLWIDKDKLPTDHLQERKIITKFFTWAETTNDLTINKMIDYLSETKKINAIQIQLTGNPQVGTMVYTVPF